MPKTLETLRHALHLDGAGEANLSVLLRCVQNAHHPPFALPFEIPQDSLVAQILNGLLYVAEKPTFIGGPMRITAAFEKGILDAFIVRSAGAHKAGNYVHIRLDRNGSNTPRPKISQVTLVSVGTVMSTVYGQELPAPGKQKELLESLAKIVLAQTLR